MQQKSQKRLLLGWLILLQTLCAGCTFHVTNDIADKLSTADLNKSFDIVPADLAATSKCAKPPTVTVRSVEVRTDDYEVLQNPPAYGVVSPKGMMEAVARYVQDAYKDSGIGLDPASAKVLELKMVDLKSRAGVWSFGSHAEFSLTIPETGYAKVYKADEGAMTGYTASAYAISRVTRQIVDDSIVQDYLLCKNNSSDTLRNSLSDRLEELKSAADKGLISAEEFQTKRKELIQNY